MSTNTVNVTETNFENEVLSSDKPVVLDFWAPWCGPCRVLGPMLENYAKDFEGKVKVVKVNVEKEQTLASTYGISAIPTLMIFDKGKIRDQVIGLPDPAKLRNIFSDLSKAA